VIFVDAPLSGVQIITFDVRCDERGFFGRTFCARTFEAAGLNSNMVQSNLSFSEQRGTLRGLHYQQDPHGEDKLVRCLSGRIFDVAVDLRPDSKTYLQWFGFELSSEKCQALYVPKGCAHGFLTLEKRSQVFYQVSNYFESGSERGLRWNDPAIGIRWPIEPRAISEKDRNHAYL